MTRLDQVGDVVVANLLNAIENPKAAGKPRPMILIREIGGCWLASGLTRQRFCRTGAERHAIPDPTMMGLNGPGFLWGPNLVRISEIDIYETIGQIHPVCAELVIAVSSLHGTWAEDLRASSHASGNTGAVTR